MEEGQPCWQGQSSLPRSSVSVKFFFQNLFLFTVLYMRGEPVLRGWIFEFHQASNFTAASAVTALLTSCSARKMCILLSTAIKCCGCPAPFASAHPLSYKMINPLNFTILLSLRTNKICTLRFIEFLNAFLSTLTTWAPYWNLAGL